MKEVYKVESVPENCSTCLYGSGFGCGNANRQHDWMLYALGLKKCPSYWLDQHRYIPVDGIYR